VDKLSIQFARFALYNHCIHKYIYRCDLQQTPEIMEVVNCMGKGDRSSKKGKIWRGSYGKTRPQKSKKAKKKSGTSSSS
jgi:30S ribosomal protein S31